MAASINLVKHQVANMEFERRQNSGQLLSRLLEADKILRWDSSLIKSHCSIDKAKYYIQSDLDNQREAAGILRLEAAGSPYGHLAASVQHNIADLSQYIESVKNM